jgi:ribA/ribD-fused uncharacterized protein
MTEHVTMEGWVIDSFSGSYRFLSNFWEHKPGLTNEHLYQAMKSSYWGEQIVVLSADTPGEAKKLGRMVTLRPDWEDIKDDVMLGLLRLKFRKGTKERHWLQDTRLATLIEGNNWNDTYWGVCKGKGKNRLGELLMQVRQEIKDGKV